MPSIDLYVGMDGCPMTSNRTSAWPILGSFPDKKEISPFLIGVYSGKGDPNDVNEYLKDFVEETKHLYENGVLVTKAKIRKPFRILAVIADSKARSWLKKVIGHTGAHGCGFCDNLAKSVLNITRRMVFPSTIGNLRTNLSFRQRVNPFHHKTGEPSLLETLDIDMVQDFPLCPMHLVHLGIVRALDVQPITLKDVYNLILTLKEDMAIIMKQMAEINYRNAALDNVVNSLPLRQETDMEILNNNLQTKQFMEAFKEWSKTAKCGDVLGDELLNKMNYSGAKGKIPLVTQKFFKIWKSATIIDDFETKVKKYMADVKNKLNQRAVREKQKNKTGEGSSAATADPETEVNEYEGNEEDA
ncbi:hypothetical protein DMENIID0001_154120 [Sergentomyia squamirostris]